MKFTESLSNAVVPEWKSQYVEYKTGKKLIKKVKALHDETENTKASDRTPLLQPVDPRTRQQYGDSPENTATKAADDTDTSKKSLRTNMFSSRASQKHTSETGKQEFEIWINNEYKKVETFYKEKEQETYERFLVLEDQLYQLKEHRNWSIRQKQKHLKSVHSEQSHDPKVYKTMNHWAYHTKDALSGLSRFDLPSLPSSTFLSIFKKDKRNKDISMTDPTPDEFDINYFENRIRNGIPDDRGDTSSIDSDSLNDFSLNATSSAVPAAQNHLTPEMIQRRRKRDYQASKKSFRVPFLLARKQLKEAMLEHYRSLILLRSYKEINRTAFRKITKKFDKVTNSEMSVEYMKKLDSDAYFLTSDILNKLVFQVEELYISFFDPQSTDRKQALEKLKSIAYALNNNQQGIISYYPEFFASGFFLGVSIPLFAMALYVGLHKIFNGTLPEGVYLLQIYGGFFLLTLMFVLFGLNMMIFNAFHINYKFIFEFNITTALDYKQFLLLPSIFFAFLSLLMFLSLNDFWRPEFPGRDWPWMFFGVGLVVFFWPFDQFYLSSRRWLQVAFLRILFSGFYPVEFRDFFLGDLLCSLTYTMGNISFFFCLYSHHWNGIFGGDETSHVCGSSKSRLMGFFAALPSIWRFLQCVRRYADTGDWFPHLANMLKYGVGAVYYCLLSVYRINKSSQNRVAFIVMASINSIYTSIWDIVMDWSLLQFNSKNWLLRDHLFYKRPEYYYTAMVVDVILRFQWIFYAFFSNQIQQLAVTSFCIAVAELIRRIIWVLFRMENEHVTNVILFRASRDSPLPYAVSTKVERAIKKLVSLRYKDRKAHPASRDAELELAVSTAVRMSTQNSIDSEASIETTNVPMDMAQLTRRRSTLANFSEALKKAHIKDFQRRKKVAIDEETDDEDDDEDAKSINQEHTD